MTTLAGAGGAGSANGAGNIATFDAPEGITVDPANGTLYVADTGNQLVRKVLSSGMTSTMPGTGTWITPKRVAFSYYLYVVDNGHDQVYTIAPNNDVTSDFALGNMQAFAIQPSAFGKFAANGYSIAKHIPANGISATGFSGTYPGGFADGEAASAKYQGAVDLAFDGASTVLVADVGNHRIRKVTVSGGADNGDVVTLAGSATAGHVDGIGAAAQFEGPNGIVVDSATHLTYVADGATIRVVTAAGDVSTLVGSSSAFVDGDGCTARFVNVKGITKFANELYVTDVNRIRKIVMN